MLYLCLEIGNGVMFGSQATFCAENQSPGMGALFKSLMGQA